MESIKQEQSKYKQTRKRVTNFYNNRDMSDKEIIESLYDEIEQYRYRIRKQEQYIKRLQDKQIKSKEVYSERNIYSCGVDTGEAKDYVVTRWYEDGILTKEEIEPVK